MRTNLKEAEIKNRELINQIQQLQSEALNKNGTTDSLGARRPSTCSPKIIKMYLDKDKIFAKN